MENKVKCSICEKEYYKRGILTHMMRMHGTKEQKSLFVCAGNGPALAAIRLKYDARIADYDAHPAKCKNCLSSLTYAKKFENSVIGRVPPNITMLIDRLLLRSRGHPGVYI